MEQIIQETIRPVEFGPKIELSESNQLTLAVKNKMAVNVILQMAGNTSL